MRRFHVPFGLKIFALIWIAVLLLPPLQESFKAQSMIQSQSLSRVNVEKLAERFPDDPRVLVLGIRGSHLNDPDLGNSTTLLNRELAEFDVLIARFPQQNWLRAMRLSYIMGHSIDMEFEGAPRRQRRRVLEKAALEKSLKCALEAEKQEPDNAFFPWMQAIIQFGLGHKNEAIDALQKAARAPRFDDYTQEGMRQRLAVYSLDHTLIFEEKMGVQFSTLVLHDYKMREAAKAATQLALDAHKRGDHHRALEICGAILGATLVFKDQSENLIARLIGQGIVRETLEKMSGANGINIRRNTDMSWEQRNDYGVALGRDFRQYARRFGRADIARLASRATLPTPSPHTNNFGEFWNEYGLQAPWGRISFQATWFVVQMGFLSLGFAAIWLATKAFFAFLHYKSRSIDGQVMPSRGQMTLSSNFSTWAMLGFGALAVYANVGFFGCTGWIQSPDSGVLNATLPASLPYITLISWLLPVAYFARKRDWVRTSSRPTPRKPIPIPQQVRWVRRVLWIAALLIGTLSYSNGRGLWDDTIFQWFASFVLLAVCIVAALSFEFYIAVRFRKLALAGFNFSPTIKQPQSNRWHFAARLAGSSAGALAVIWSLFFLAGALGLWPLRTALNRGVERRIAIGELKWMQEQNARKSGDETTTR